MRWICVPLGALLLAGCGLLSGGTPTPGQPPTLPPPAVTHLPAPDAEAAAGRFLDAWKEGDYEAMYAMLTPLTQDALSFEDFKARYDEVRVAAAITGVDYEIVSSLVNPQSAQVRYRVTLSSAVVGDLVRETFMDLKRIEGEWRVAWSETTILPELEGGNRLRLTIDPPTRANIYDREGQGLAVQEEVVGLYIVPNTIGDEDAEDAMLRVLSRLLDERPENIQARYDAVRGTDYLIPLGEVRLSEFQRVQGTLAAVGGVQWGEYSGRFYVDGGLAPHAVGYVQQISREEVDDYMARGYLPDEFVGRTGIEAAFQDDLRGKPQGVLLLTDAGGQVIEKLAERPSEPAQAVYTTLDRDLQRYAQQAMAGFNGAIVVLERDTGAVLAMVSSPGFDPNLFHPRNPNSGDGLTLLFQNRNQPLVNRATHGLYPLGSVFKIITMAAALESGEYADDTIYTCDGYFRELPGYTFTDWTVEKDLPPHGELTLVQGLERSCNPYFWHIGLDLYNKGMTTALPDMAAAFGLGKPTGIEIGDEAGVVPNPEWKLENVGEEWGPGDAVQLAIGQAQLNITPLQVARFIAAVGNGGTLYRPYLVERVQSPEGQVSYQATLEVQGQLPVSPENLAVIQQAMAQVVRAPKGTARRRFLGLNLNVAGKTGTATSGFGEPHAWFAGYTFEEREDKPDIAVVVIVENQGEGSEWAAPIFRRVLEAYFFGRPLSLYPWESQIGVTRTPTPTEGPEAAAPEGTPTP